MSIASSLLLPRRRPVLVDRLPRSSVTTAVLVVAGAALTAACAQFSFPVPGSPVPVTGQTFAVLICGAALGPARGVAAQLLYVSAGVLGAPVFSEQSHGLGVLLGATGGYLIGFILAAVLMGWGGRQGLDRRVWSEAVVVTAATLAIYVCGTGWLAIHLGVGVGAAVSVGVLPFLVGDAVKALLAAGLLPAAWRLVDRVELGRRR